MLFCIADNGLIVASDMSFHFGYKKNFCKILWNQNL